MNKTTIIAWSVFPILTLYCMFCLPHGDPRPSPHYYDDIKSAVKAQQIRDAEQALQDAKAQYDNATRTH